MSNETQTTETVTSITPNVDKLLSLAQDFTADVTKFYTKGTASAAARARKSLSAFTKLSKVVRKEIQVRKFANAEKKKASKVATTE